MALPTLSQISVALRSAHGAQKPIPKSAFQWVLWENCAYLANPAKRAQAFALLKRTVGFTPSAIKRARMATLLAVTRHGIVAPLFARKLKLCADIALDEFDGDVDAALSPDAKMAARQLRKFPGIGEPGAEKILSAIGRVRTLALDSNALRVLQRIGYGKALKSYSATYRSVKQTVPLGRMTSRALFQASLLLQRHGQQVCKTSAPLCSACVVRNACDFARRRS